MEQLIFIIQTFFSEVLQSTTALAERSPHVLAILIWACLTFLGIAAFTIISTILRSISLVFKSGLSLNSGFKNKYLDTKVKLHSLEDRHRVLRKSYMSSSERVIELEASIKEVTNDKLEKSINHKGQL